MCGFKWKRNESIKQILFLKIKNKMIQLIYPILNQKLVCHILNMKLNFNNDKLTINQLTI